MGNHVGEMTVNNDEHHGFHGCGEPECLITDSSISHQMENEELN
jgi:hypothetical protein